MTEPKPISTAPERECVLIHDPNYGDDFVVIAQFFAGRWDDGMTPNAYEPTQWWPLPKPSAKALN